MRLSIAVSMTWWADVGDLKTDVATMKTDIADTKAVTEDVKKWKLMGMGALGVTGIAAGAIASFITAYWADIMKLLRGGWANVRSEYVWRLSAWQA